MPASTTEFPGQDAQNGARDRVAGGMESAASSLHERAETMPGGPRVARAAHATAGAMESAAAYMRDRDMKAMLSDVGAAARRHPGVTLLAATAVGFLLARMFTRH